MIKSSRHVDPKLRIRPFRSKVTFSDDTKNNDDNTLQVRNAGRGFHQYHGDSSSESNSSLMRFQQDIAQQPSQHSKLRSKHTSSTVIQDSKSKTFSIQKSLQDSGTFFEKRKRRQSMDPTIYHQRDKTILLQDPEINQDNWLHYQSLPNIQEEDQQIVGLLTLHDTNPSSTIPTASDSLAIGVQTIPLPDIRCQRLSPTTQQQKQSDNIPSSSTSSSMTVKQASDALLLSPATSSSSSKTIPEKPTTTSSSWNSARKKSIKRQKSQEIPDEDLKLRLSSSQQTPVNKMIIIKQSSSESQGSSSNSSSNKGITMMPPPPGILKKRNETIPIKQQASTESDTGSYHTVRSLIMNPSSSIDSFTSAVSDPLNNNNNNSNGSSSNGQNDSTTVTINLDDDNQQQQQQFKSSTSLLMENRLQHSYHSTIESSLVPKIIFSQSTPSVTSQSSDDQNSPKWDSERYSQFSESMETVVIQQQQQHNTITDPNQTLRIQKNNNNKQTSTTNNNLSSTIEDDLMAKSNHKSVPSSSIVFDSAASSSSSSSLSSNPLESSLPTQQSSSLTIRKC